MLDQNAPLGTFITFEGTEGSGKSTLIGEVLKSLTLHGVSATATREPGGSGLAEQVRNLILNFKMNPLSELLLYEAARASHVAEIIRPALLEGRVVLCDRFTDSTLAYQGHARGLPWEEVKILNRIATGGLIPDLTFFLDLDPSLGLTRVQNPNRFEQEGEEFHRRVHAGYLKVQAEDPNRWHVLDSANKTPSELSVEVVQTLKLRFNFLRGSHG